MYRMSVYEVCELGEMCNQYAIEQGGTLQRWKLGLSRQHGTLLIVEYRKAGEDYCGTIRVNVEPDNND